MSKLCSVTVNGDRFTARPGDVLLDAALINGIDVPHDCRSGQCGACVVRRLSGRTLAGQGASPGTVRACQARIMSDLEITFDDVPEVRAWRGRVAAVRALTFDVAEVTITPKRPIVYVPGQYLQVQFAGLPSRAYSPTVGLATPAHDGLIRFHIRRLDGGCVSSKLGSQVRSGHRVRLRGPYGAAYFRRALPNRLVLVSGGTGFAPIWAIADAALRESARRPIVLVAGVHSLHSLYMAQALELLSACRNVALRIVTEEPQQVAATIANGRPCDVLPALGPHDLVYAAGPPGMVESVAAVATRAQAVFHADPFVANGSGEGRWLARMLKKRSGIMTGRPALLGPAVRPSPTLRHVLSELRQSEPALASARGEHRA